MIVLEPHDESGWITAIIGGRWVQAKVYNEPSTFGINNGRVSKLAVGKTASRDANKPFHPQMCYHYDRGLDIDEAPPGLVSSIVEQLEKLPLLQLDD